MWLADLKMKQKRSCISTCERAMSHAIAVLLQSTSEESLEAPGQVAISDRRSASVNSSRCLRSSNPKNWVRSGSLATEKRGST